jgi:hypothetical protein
MRFGRKLMRLSCTTGEIASLCAASVVQCYAEIKEAAWVLTFALLQAAAAEIVI